MFFSIKFETDQMRLLRLLDRISSLNVHKWSKLNEHNVLQKLNQIRNITCKNFQKLNQIRNVTCKN